MMTTMNEIEVSLALAIEAQRLSQEVWFNFERGCFLEGERVCILADVEPEEEEGQYRVGVMVFPLGSMRPDMTGFRVTLRGKAGSGVLLLRPGATNRRGHVTFHGLPAGNYALSFPLVLGRSEEPVRAASLPYTAAEDLESLQLAAETELKKILEDTRAEEEIDWLKPKIYSSPEDPVQCTVRRTVTDSLEVAFETRQADFAGAKVWFAFVEPATHRLLLEGEVTLAETEEPGVWEGVWLSEPGFCLEAEGELVFEVVGSGS